MLILKIASREQYEVTLIRQHTIWAKLNEETELTLDQYVKREKLLTSSKFGERFLAWLVLFLLRLCILSLSFCLWI